MKTTIFPINCEEDDCFKNVNVYTLKFERIVFKLLNFNILCTTSYYGNVFLLLGFYDYTSSLI